MHFLVHVDEIVDGVVGAIVDDGQHVVADAWRHVLLVDVEQLSRRQGLDLFSGHRSQHLVRVVVTLPTHLFEKLIDAHLQDLRLEHLLGFRAEVVEGCSCFRRHGHVAATVDVRHRRVRPGGRTEGESGEHAEQAALHDPIPRKKALDHGKISSALCAKSSRHVK